MVLKKMIRYLSNDLWDFPLEKEKGFRHFYIKWLRIFTLSLRKYYENNCPAFASSLTYLTLMSIVPVLALSIVITRLIGFSEQFKTDVLSHFTGQERVFTEFFKYSEEMLPKEDNLLIIILGIAFLTGSVVLLLICLEQTLNMIWDAVELRSWKRLFFDYSAIIVVSPIFFIGANAMLLYISTSLESTIRLLPLNPHLISWVIFAVRLIPHILFWLLFMLIYYILPNKKVHFKGALIAGIFTGSLYLIMQWEYVHFQLLATRMGTVYGSMAALPLFLMWNQFSWLLLLFGSQMSYAYQNHTAYEFENRVENASYRLMRLLTLWILYLSITKKEGITLDMLKVEYKLPPKLLKPLFNHLTLIGLLTKKEEKYFPSNESTNIKLSKSLQIIDVKGENELMYISPTFQRFCERVENGPKDIRLEEIL